MLNDFTPAGVSKLTLFGEVQPWAHSEEQMKFLDGINHSALCKSGLKEKETLHHGRLKEKSCHLPIQCDGKIFLIKELDSGTLYAILFHKNFCTVQNIKRCN